MHTLRKYALIYVEFLRTGFAAATSYRLHFALLVALDLLFYPTLFTAAAGATA